MSHIKLRKILGRSPVFHKCCLFSRVFRAFLKSAEVEVSSNWRQDTAVTGALEACRYELLVLASVDWMFRLLALMRRTQSRFVAIEYGC
jgi:hypothetical protein